MTTKHCKCTKDSTSGYSSYLRAVFVLYSLTDRAGKFISAKQMLCQKKIEEETQFVEFFQTQSSLKKCFYVLGLFSDSQVIKSCCSRLKKTGSSLLPVLFFSFPQHKATRSFCFHISLNAREREFLPLTEKRFEKSHQIKFIFSYPSGYRAKFPFWLY